MTAPASLLHRHSRRPQKHLGQCFLKDAGVADRIVRAAELNAEDAVLEIGAGLGMMTRRIAPRVNRVVAVEIDDQLLVPLAEETASFPGVRIIHGDILQLDISALAAEAEVGAFKVLGNIPYYISTPILFHLLDYRRCLTSVTLMMQKEVADRLTAMPGSKAYGIPTVMLRVWADIAMVFTVSPTCFFPEPKVVSAVVRIDFRRDPGPVPVDEALFRRLVKTAFGQRRKTLWNNLKGMVSGQADEACLRRALEAEDVDAHARAETLRPDQFVGLANRLFSILEDHRGSIHPT